MIMNKGLYYYFYKLWSFIKIGLITFISVIPFGVLYFGAGRSFFQTVSLMFISNIFLYLATLAMMTSMRNLSEKGEAVTFSSFFSRYVKLSKSEMACGLIISLLFSILPYLISTLNTVPAISWMSFIVLSWYFFIILVIPYLIVLQTYFYWELISLFKTASKLVFLKLKETVIFFSMTILLVVFFLKLPLIALFLAIPCYCYFLVKLFQPIIKFLKSI